MRRSSRQQQQQQDLAPVASSSANPNSNSASQSSLPQLPPILQYPPASTTSASGYAQQGFTNHRRGDEQGSYIQSQPYQQQLAPRHAQQHQSQLDDQRQRLADQQQQQQQPQNQPSGSSSRRGTSKRESASEMLANQAGAGPSGSRSAIDDAMPSASDFVKKLYKMLEDQSIANVVSWGPNGDCFVVKDMNEFTKSILPRLFKHSNFASFVRQLNKYDFHKVKNSDDNQFGEHSWTFRHQNFHADRREDLENIKRKVPAGRKPTTSLPPVSTSTSQPPAHTTQPLSTSSSGGYNHRNGGGDYPYSRRGSQSRHHSPSPPSPGSYEYGGYDHDSGYEHQHRHRRGHDHHSHSHSRHSPPSSSYDHLQSQLSAIQSQLNTLGSSTSALGSQIRALAESQAGLERGVESVRGEIADVRRRESEIRDEVRRGILAASNTSSGGASLALSSELTQLSRQTTKLTQDSDSMGRRVGELERGYKSVLGEVGVLQRGLLGAASAASTLSLGGGGGGGGAPQSLEEMLKSETGVGMDSMTGVEASTPGGGYWGVRGLVGGWLEGSNPNTPGRGPGEGSSTSAGAAASASANVTSGATRGSDGNDNASGGPGLDSSKNTGAGGQGSTSSPHTNSNNPSSSSTSTNNINLSSTDDSRNPFLPMQLPPDAARASLMQMNELSRRADQAGFSLDFGEGFEGGSVGAAAGGTSSSSSGASGSWQQQDQSQSQQRPPSSSKIWEAAANAGLFGNGGFSFGGNATSSGGGSNNATGAGASTTSTWPDTPFDLTQTGLSSGTSPSSSSSPSEAVMSHEGLQVYTVGHLVPRDQIQESQWTFGDLESSQSRQQQQGTSQQGYPYRRQSDTNSPESSALQQQPNLNTSFPSSGHVASSSAPSSSTTSSPTIPSTSSSNALSKPSRPKLRVRRSTFVPGWAVPPRVLLVDDDAVSRKLGSKFLQVFGCAIDVAVDGVGAVNKMNLEKYDLVLMDIVMPKLDGISATSMIRKFDPMTPIISMTSNSKPSEIMTYYSSGMNDILPKPFTKEGMLDMLEKHLMHLRIIQQMSKGVPPSIGIPPLSDQGFVQAIRSQAGNLLTAGPSGSSSSSSSNLPTNATASSSAGSSGNTANDNNNNDSLILGGNGSFSGDDDGRINPLAGMGLSDEQYNAMLTNMVNGDPFFTGMSIETSGVSIAGRRNGSGSSPGSSGSGMGGGLSMDLGMGMGMGQGQGQKRGYEGDGEDGGSGKRSRFEVIE